MQRIARRSPALQRRAFDAALVLQILLRPAAKEVKLAVSAARATVEEQGWTKLERMALCRLLRAVRRAAEDRFAPRFDLLVAQLKA
jgi:hypothetical protein